MQKNKIIRREGSIVKKSKTFSRKLCAGILSVCLTVGVLAGNFIPGTGKNVSGAITSFTKNDFLKQI